MLGISHNGIMIAVEHWPQKKLPVLAVHFDGENKVYKVASFKDEQTAEWFCEVMEEFFSGIAMYEPAESFDEQSWNKLIDDIRKQALKEE